MDQELAPKARLRVLRKEARRRAMNGESAVSICAELGISKSGYFDWARRDGFRLCDLQPEATKARGTTPVGTQTVRRDLAREAAEAVAAKVAGLTDLEVLNGVRGAMARGDVAEADRWLAAWQRKQRRARTLAALERAVQGFDEGSRPIGASGQPMRTLAEIQAMSDEDLETYVESLVAKSQSGEDA